MLAVGSFALPGLAQIEMIVVERGRWAVQTGPDTVVPLGDINQDGKTYTFRASILPSEGGVNLARMTGPNHPWPGATLVYEPEDNEYLYEVQYASAAELQAAIPSGSYTISGDSTTSGSFMENVELTAYSELDALRVVNYADLQSFNPGEPLHIEWQPFVQGQTMVYGLNLGYDGVVGVELRYGYDGSSNQIYTSDDYVGEGAFGFSPMLTSVDIPAHLLGGSPDGAYELNLTFIHVTWTGQPVFQNVGFLVVINTYELSLVIHEAGSGGNPWDPYNVSPEGWTDTGNWLGVVNIANRPWIWSGVLNSYLYIPDEAIDEGGGWAFAPAP